MTAEADSTLAAPAGPSGTDHPAPDRSDAARKRTTVAVTAVMTVWGVIFLGVFAVYVAGTSTKTPGAPPAFGPREPAQPGPVGPAGQTGPFIPPTQPAEEPGHEGHGHAPGEHGKGQ